MRLVPLVMVLCSYVALSAPRHAPLPKQVYEAKSVFIVNQSGYQSTADGAFEALTKWGALSVVSNKSEADLIMTFTYGGDEMVKGTTSWGRLFYDSPASRNRRRRLPGELWRRWLPYSF